MSDLLRFLREQFRHWRLYAGAALGTIAAYLLFGQLLIQAIAVLGFTVLGALAVLVPLVLLRARRMKLATRRPDYSLIARMEREVWGETFEHAGGPGVAVPGTEAGWPVLRAQAPRGRMAPRRPPR